MCVGVAVGVGMNVELVVAVGMVVGVVMGANVAVGVTWCVAMTVSVDVYVDGSVAEVGDNSTAILVGSAITISVNERIQNTKLISSICSSIRSLIHLNHN